MDYSWEAITLFVLAVVGYGHLNWRITVLERRLADPRNQSDRASMSAER